MGQREEPCGEERVHIRRVGEEPPPEPTTTIGGREETHASGVHGTWERERRLSVTRILGVSSIGNVLK